MVRSVVAAMLLVVGQVWAGTDGLVVRALGWYAGKADISDGQIKCEIPTTTTAIADGSFAVGLWNTYGTPTLFFPDSNSALGNPCGGWLQVGSNLQYMGLTTERVRVRFRVHGAQAAWLAVPTRRGFPTSCRALRRATLESSARLLPASSSVSASGSGRPEVAFLQIRPLLSSSLVHCLREQYTRVDPNTLASITVVATATVEARDDAGHLHRSNPVRYTVNLRHTCGNGRVDDGEMCDAAASTTCGGGLCKNGECSLAPGVACTDNADCVGTCVAPGSPIECTCRF